MASRSPDTKFGKFDQGAAGTTTILASPGAGKKIVLKSLVILMAAAGTAKLQSAANDITGALPVGANGGCVLPPVKDEAWLECNPNEALNLVTVTGAAKGLFSYTIDPA